MKKSKKLISLGVSLAILVTSTGFAFAASNRAYDPGTHKEGIIKVQQKDWGRQSGAGLLSKLVTAGTITAEQQKAVVAAMKPSKGTAVTLENALAGLVTAGTLTQAQADAVAKAYSDAKAKLEAEKEKCLAELAEKKGITVEELKAQMEKGRIGTVDKSGFRAGTGLKNGRVHAR